MHVILETGTYKLILQNGESVLVSKCSLEKQLSADKDTFAVDRHDTDNSLPLFVTDLGQYDAETKMQSKLDSSPSKKFQF